jgi:hypothetical protein
VVVALVAMHRAWLVGNNLAGPGVLRTVVAAEALQAGTVAGMGRWCPGLVAVENSVVVEDTACQQGVLDTVVGGCHCIGCVPRHGHRGRHAANRALVLVGVEEGLLWP